MTLPRHLAVIMDGNGRWAQARGHSRVFGHVRGANAAKDLIENCAQLGIENLTLFTFSTENWLRPPAEVSLLMTLLFRRLRRELPLLMKNNIRFRTIGDLSRLPETVQRRVRETVAATQNNSGMNLVFALNYGGRQELVAGVRHLAEMVRTGELRPEDIDQETLSASLESHFLPDPDLIVRTSGEHRLSNFYLWQAAYSEIFITPKLWPDFAKSDLLAALEEFSRRERRFGRTSAQLHVASESPHS